jgi:hypothetical protein
MWRGNQQAILLQHAYLAQAAEIECVPEVATLLFKGFSAPEKSSLPHISYFRPHDSLFDSSIHLLKHPAQAAMSSDTQQIFAYEQVEHKSCMCAEGSDGKVRPQQPCSD